MKYLIFRNPVPESELRPSMWLLGSPGTALRQPDVGSQPWPPQGLPAADLPGKKTIPVFFTVGNHYKKLQEQTQKYVLKMRNPTLPLGST